MRLGSLGEIERTVRSQLLEHVAAEVRINCSAGEDAGPTRKLVSILGTLQMGSQQAQRLEVRPRV
jgi:hypothetical protein